MKKIQKSKEDIIDIMTGDIDMIKEVRYYTHLDPSKVLMPQVEYDEENECAIVRINTSQLMTLENGELMCEIDLKTDDASFNDAEYNTTITEGLAIWLL